MSANGISEWVSKAIGSSKLSQADVAELLKESLRRGFDRAAVNKMVSGIRGLAADEMLALEEITGIPVPSPNVATKVPLLDWVSAGKLSEPQSQAPAENVPMLSFADLGPGDFFALKVQGNSMDRISPEGSIIVIDRNEKELLSGRCYIFSWRGETTYKRWRGDDPPYLEPYSTDPVHRPVFIKGKRGLEVVGRVRRTTLDL